jgi:hypothetical protein
VFTLRQVLQALRRGGAIDEATFTSVTEYLDTAA